MPIDEVIDGASASSRPTLRSGLRKRISAASSSASRISWRDEQATAATLRAPVVARN